MKLKSVDIAEYCRIRGYDHLVESPPINRHYFMQQIGSDKGQIVQIISPEIGYSHLKDVKLFSDHGLIYDDEYIVFRGLHHSNYNPEITLGEYCPQGYNFKWVSKDEAELKNLGPYVSVINHKCIFVGGADNFGHLFYQFLSRAYQLRFFDYDNDDGREIVVYDHLPKRFYDFVRMAVPGLKMTLISKDRVYQFKDIIMPNALMFRGAWTNLKSCASPEAIYHLRSKFLDSRKEPEKRRRLFVSRENEKWRRMLNRDVVWPKFEALGFEKIDFSKHSAPEQIKIIGEAEMVALESGASSFITAFAPLDCRIVEFNLEGTACHFGSWINALILGQPFVRIDGLADKRDDVRFMDWDYWVNVEEVDRIIKVLGE